MKEDKGYRDFSELPDHELEWAAVDSKDERKRTGVRSSSVLKPSAPGDCHLTTADWNYFRLIS